MFGLSMALTRGGGRGGAAGVNISDDYNRADSAVSLGATSVGAKVWSALVGVWGVLTNQAYLTAAATDAIAVFDAGVSDCTVALVLRNAIGNQGIAFRAVDAANYWRAVFFSGSLYLQKNVAGVMSTAPGAPIVQAAADGDVLSVVLAGNGIIVKLNGVQKLTTVDAQHVAATKHGLAQSGGGDPTNKYDDISVLA